MGPSLDHLRHLRVAVTLAKQRLMTASYDYFDLRYPHEGLKGGFIYKTVPHITLKNIANNPEIDTIYEQDAPGHRCCAGAAGPGADRPKPASRSPSPRACARA